MRPRSGLSGHVCNDLMVDIFERLPPKSIIRLRSLSKYWHSHLRSPEFLHNHRHRCSKNPPKVIIRHVIACGNHYREIYTWHSGDQLPSDPGSGYVGIPGVEFPYNQRAWITSVVGSCNGILCLRDKETISLCNFSIRRKLIVSYPYPPLKSTSRKVALGFGFDPITDDYKIVAFSYSRYKLDENTAFIYSLKTDSWSAIASLSTQHSYIYVEPKACFLNGILHWVVDGHSAIEPTPKGRSYFILTFNLSSHVFGYILLPEYWIINQPTIINGCLAVVSPENNKFWKDCYSRIRVMKEYGKTESWSTLFKVKREALCGIRVFQPITNGDILAYKYNHRWSKVYITQTWFIKILEFGPDCCKVEMNTYVESLELVDQERATACGKTIFSWTKKE